MRIAIIDCGTNTFNLLIVERNKNQFKHLYKTKRAVKLGSGGILKRIISEKPQERAIKALTEFKNIASKFNIKKTLVVGTAAIRDAKNRFEFLNEIKRRTGYSIKLISGVQEAKLIYKGVCNAVQIGDEPTLILDIGGGSVEFIICNNTKIFWKKSFRIGGARLLEQINPSDPIKPIEIIKLNNYLEEKLNDLFNAVEKFKPQKLIGSSGSFDTFAEIILNKTNNLKLLRGNTHYQFNISDYKILHRELVKSNYLDRLKIKGMLRMRADMIVVASLLLTFVLSKTGIRSLHLSTYALKEGLLSELTNNNF